MLLSLHPVHSFGFISFWIDWLWIFVYFSLVYSNHLVSSRVNLANELGFADAFILNLFLLMLLSMIL